MAISIVSSNLNIYGNNGQFETDPSTWGFGAEADYEITRSGLFSTAGIYSARVRATALNNVVDGHYESMLLGRASFVAGRNYILKAKVRVPSATPIAAGAETISFQIVPLEVGVYFNVVSQTSKTVTEATDSWVEITLQIAWLFSTSSSFFIVHSGANSIVNGLVYIDQLEIYQYIDVPDVVTCDVDIDEIATTIVNETAPGANNGSITVVSAGTGTLEYSKDGITWQLSHIFAGLTTGIYLIHVRQQADISCIDSYPFSVNHTAIAFDFTSIVTDESVSGAHDGAISITPTGAGGPFDFSIDAGTTWFGTNNFIDLAPGLYYVAVRNTAGNALIKPATVAAGTIDFDKIYHSKNPITLGASAAPGWTLLTNYRLYNDVRVEDVADSGNYVSKLKTELPPDTLGNVVFYSRQAFRGVFTYTPPNYNETEIIRLTDRIKRFKNYTGELTGTDTVPGSLTASVADLVIYGGIDKVNYPGLNYFTSYLPTHKKFLTWAPVEKYVDRLQEDYLNFWVYGNYNQLKLQLKVYFDDDTNETSVVKTKTGTKFSELYQVPAGPLNSGALLVNPAKTAIKYELSLLNQVDDVISEVRTYYISLVRHPLTRFFLFLNSLGGFETLLFTGQAQEGTTIARDIVQKYLPYNYAALDGEFEVDINSPNIQKKQNYSSGYIKNRLAKEWHEYMIDLLNSARIYDVTKGLRNPIVITAEEHNTADQDYERYVRFTSRPAYDNESFTPSSI